VINIPIFKYEDIDINYFKRGKGEPLVLLGGWGQTMGTWRLLIPFFKRKMMVITLDQRGVGKSSSPNYPYTMDMFVDETNELLNFLGIRERIHLLGMSMGGMTAQHFTLKYSHRVKTLILLGTSAFIQEEHEPLFKEYKEIMNELNPEDGFKRICKTLFSDSFLKRLDQDKILKDAVYEELMVKDRTKWQTYVNQSTAIRNHDTRSLLHKIAQPTLILHGTTDKQVPFSHAKLLHEKIPHSKFIRLDGLGHGSLLVEDFERVNNLIWDFIKANIN